MYERLATFKIEEVLPFIGNHKREYAGVMVKMGSARYRVFKKSLACSREGCPRVGSFFALERSRVRRDPQPPHDRPYHFNLYAVDPGGNEVLMTKDHIIPRSLGGLSTLKNYTTMCAPCNCSKGASAPTDVYIAFLEDKVQKLREKKDGAFGERDKLIAALSKLLPAWLETHPSEDKEWPEHYRTIVFIEGPAGQMCWHIHFSEVELFKHLEHREGSSWDGHTSEEKYERLAGLSAIG